jgi:transcriptional regulator with XRE-family HTH domain
MATTRKPDYDSAFAKKLRELLDTRAISMTELAKKLEVKQQTVSQWANGSTTPKLKHLKPLASYFEISIDELVTGIAPKNEEFHLDTGLSNLAIEKLKKLKAGNAEDDNNRSSAKFDSKIIIEFLNIIIERMDYRFHSLSRLAYLCIEYITGAHKPILEQEELKEEKAKGYDILVHQDRPNLENDDLDFKTYRLTKDFENFIVDLAKMPEIVMRLVKIYEEFNHTLPDYSDRRFGPGAFGNTYSDSVKTIVAEENINSKDNMTNTPLD